MRVTDYSLTTNDVLGTIPFINQIGLNNLSESGRVKRKKVLGVWKYCRYSVNRFLQSFNVDDYVTISQTKQILKSNGIRDIFNRFSDKSETLKCKYERVTNQFPMSVKNLIGYGYLEIDKDVKPTMIKKDSVIKTIKHFSGKRVKQQPKKPKTSNKKVSTQKVVTPKPSNNFDYYQRLLEKLGETSS